MAFGDDTLVDAPVTPAPVFAYRALRAVFWGEPDTPDPASIHKPFQATHKTNNNDVVQAITAPLDLTSGQKRKHTTLVPVSPSKSILRTPGAHTPRRALLKDINVKFKDLRKSASPELAQKQSLIQKKMIAVENNSDKENRHSSSQETGDAHKAKSDMEKQTWNNRSQAQTATHSLAEKEQALPSIVRKQSMTTTGSMAPTSLTEFDPETFSNNTEKEVKKLIKYAQKMREYARRQDDENKKLKVLLEDMRKENERLQKELDSKANTTSDVSHRSRHGEFDARNTQPTTSVKPRDSLPQPTRSTTRTSDHALALLDLEHKSTKTTQSASGTQRSKRPHQDSILHEDREPPATNKSHSNRDHSPSKRQRHAHHENSTSKPAPASSQERRLPLRPLANSTTTNTNTNANRLAPDRLAAARARVRKKAELRKASAVTDVENVRTADRARVGAMGKDMNVVETSLVDWAGL